MTVHGILPAVSAIFNRHGSAIARAFANLILVLSLLPALGSYAWGAEGFLEPFARVNLNFPTRGILARLYVHEGQRVKKGQVVAELDSRLLQAALAEARKVMHFHGKIDSAQALLSLRRSRLDSLEALMKSGNARRRELERARTDLAMAQAGLLMAREESQVNALEYRKTLARIEEKKLRSPIRGVVTRVYKQAAELVGGLESQPLMTVVQLDPLKAVFHLAPQKAALLKPGRNITLAVAGNSAPVSGKVKFISPVIDPESGTVRVTLEVPNPRRSLLSGARCTLKTD